MYEELKNNQVKIVIKEGDSVNVLRGIFLDYENNTFKIEIGGRINYFEKQYVIRIRLDNEG